MAGPQPEREKGEGGRKSPIFRPGGRYSAFVGLAFIGLIVVAAINAARTGEGTILGTEEILGEPLAEFAVPDIRGPLDGDANVAQDDCETSANPCPAEDARMPACEIDPEGAIRICDLFDRPLVVSFWFTRGADCLDAQDSFDAVAEDYGGKANFLSVNIRDARDEVEEIVSERGWTVPVGWDRDGAVSNILRIGVCPTVAFVFPGGIFQTAEIGEDALGEEDLGEHVRALIRQSREREESAG
jgi:thiol-disulfide isomerase/thioredoxin